MSVPDSTKTVILLQQLLTQAFRTNSLLTMIQMTLEAQAGLAIDLAGIETGPKAKLIDEFEKRRDGMFEELKRHSRQECSEMSSALIHALFPGSESPAPITDEQPGEQKNA